MHFQWISVSGYTNMNSRKIIKSMLQNFSKKVKIFLVYFFVLPYQGWLLKSTPPPVWVFFPPQWTYLLVSFHFYPVYRRAPLPVCPLQKKSRENIGVFAINIKTMWHWLILQLNTRGGHLSTLLEVEFQKLHNSMGLKSTVIIIVSSERLTLWVASGRFAVWQVSW